MKGVCSTCGSARTVKRWDTPSDWYGDVNPHGSPGETWLCAVCSGVSWILPLVFVGMILAIAASILG